MVFINLHFLKTSNSSTSQRLSWNTSSVRYCPTVCATPITVMGSVMGLHISIMQWGLLSDCYKANPIGQWGKNMVIVMVGMNKHKSKCEPPVLTKILLYNYTPSQCLGFLPWKKDDLHLTMNYKCISILIPLLYQYIFVQTTLQFTTALAMPWKELPKNVINILSQNHYCCKAIEFLKVIIFFYWKYLKLLVTDWIRETSLLVSYLEFKFLSIPISSSSICFNKR